MRIQDPSDRLVYRLTRGRSTLSSWLSGLPIAMLTTTGARSGQPRTVPVLAIPDGNAVVVIASNFGRPRHPAWYRNLQAHPRATITVARATSDVEADELHGPTREHALHRGIEMFPPFAGYQTLAAQRRIPVLRLNPVATRQESASSVGDVAPSRRLDT
jgi:deazaflavin-dependent oxidoreductase (nitroreductase family)